MKSTDIVVVGSINVDIVLHVALHPVPGETILATGQSAGFGGKGANQAVAAARAGAAVRFVGAVGDDDAGPAARQNLTDAGIDTEFVRTVAGPTGAAYLTVADDGENSIIVVGGANSSLTAEDIDDVADLLTSAAVVVLQLEVPLVVVERAIAAATVVIVNAAPAQTLPPAVLAQVDVLIVNEGEAAALLDGTVPAQSVSTPRAGIARDDAGDLTAALLALGPAAVVITLGARGAAWRTGDAAGTVAAPPVDVVDTTGAGDAFVGAFAAALAHVALVDADLADADGVDADSVDAARVDAALVDHSRSGGDITGSAVAAAVEAGVDHASWATTFAGAQPPGSFPAPYSFPVR